MIVTRKEIELVSLLLYAAKLIKVLAGPLKVPTISLRAESLPARCAEGVLTATRRRAGRAVITP